MTQVTFYRKESGEYTGFRLEGHAGYAEEGEDIVCAAISALAINTVNSIVELTEDKPDVEMNEDEAIIALSFPDGKSGEKSQLLMKSLVLGLTGLEEDETGSEFIDVIVSNDAAQS